MRQENVIFSFNRGRVSRYGLARTDVKRIALSADTQTNYIPRVLGAMSFRPGMQYLGATKSNKTAALVPFIFSVVDTAILEFTDSVLRVWVNDALVTRPSVSSAVTNGNFTANVTGWTPNDEGTAASTWNAAGYLQLVGTGSDAAIRDQTVTVAAGDVGKVHALRIVIARGPVTLRVGTNTTDESYVHETVLATGTHSLSFTPAGDFNIRFMSRYVRQTYVDSCNVEAAGVMELPTPWVESKLGKLRWDQSADIIFFACDGVRPQQVERRSTTSWSVVDLFPIDGPFGLVNTGPISLTAGALNGNTTLTASKSLFNTTHVGSLFKLISEGQAVSATINALPPAGGTWTNSMEVSGVASDRTFTIIATGAWTGTVVTLQRSLGAPGSWVDVQTCLADLTTTANDGLDNQIVYYRFGVKQVDWVAGTNITASLSISTGSITGVVRVTGYTSQTVVNIEVLQDVGTLNATTLWYQGLWGTDSYSGQGWPSALTLHEGRLWFSGKSRIWGSVSDQYDSFKSETVGDSGPISRSFGSGPVDSIMWMSSNQRLLVGAEASEYSARASTLDEPLTPTAFVIKPASNQGCAAVPPAKIDNRVLFVQRSGSKVYELSFDARWYDYSAKDITAIIPEIGYPGIVTMAVQRQQDTRVHCVRSDGTVALHVTDRNEDMQAWVDVTTNGSVEIAVVLPGGTSQTDDNVYYLVKRTINGSTVRYLEKWAQFSETVGGTVTKLADAFVQYSGPPTTTFAGLDHLEGQQVSVWADGNDVGTNDDYTYKYTVYSGGVTIGTAATNVVIGLPYTAQYKSIRLGSQTNELSTVITHYRNINHIGFMLADTHNAGLRFGPDFVTMDVLPRVERGRIVAAGEIYTDYEEALFEFRGSWDQDSRLCFQSQSPRPATVLAAVMDLEIP